MPNPLTSTKKAVELRLATLGLPIAYENVEYKPVAGQKYVICQFVPRNPDDPTIGDTYYRERTELQLFVCDALNIGTAGALNTAQSIRDLFPKGWYVSQDGYKVYTFNTAQIKGAVKTNDRLVVPVIIDLVTEVYS
jgi:Bacteriophage related domain of unknown function